MRIVGFCQALPFLMLCADQFVVLAHAWMLSHASCLQETNASGDTLRAHALTDFGPSTSLADGSASPELPSYPPSSQDPPQSSDASAIDSETEAAVQEKQAPPQGEDKQAEGHMDVWAAAAGDVVVSTFLPRIQYTMILPMYVSKKVQSQQLVQP